MKELINNLTIIHMLILVFGSYSITRLIVTDDFPLFEKPRNKLHHHFPHDGYSSAVKPLRGNASRAGGVWYVARGHWLGDLFHCPWCMGWWVSLGISVGYWFNQEVTLLVLIPFALRAAVGGLANRFGG